MSKDERYLKKIGKLLTLYGVSEEEKKNFLTDIQDAKYDDPEDEEEEEKVEMTSKEETLPKEESTEEKVGEEEESSEKVEEEQSIESEGEESEEEESESEELESQEESESELESQDEEKAELETPPTEEVVEEEKQSEETIEFDPRSEIEELKKTNEGLSARLATLEDIVSKLGVEIDEEDQTIGASSKGNAIDETQESAFDAINRKRIGY